MSLGVLFLLIAFIFVSGVAASIASYWAAGRLLRAPQATLRRAAALVGWSTLLCVPLYGFLIWWERAHPDLMGVPIFGSIVMLAILVAIVRNCFGAGYGKSILILILSGVFSTASGYAIAWPLKTLVCVACVEYRPSCYSIND